MKLILARRQATFFALFSLCAGFALPTLAQAAASPSISDQEVTQIARDAYIYAYPFVLQDLTRQQVTNVAAVHFPNAPINQLANAPAFPPPEMKVVVRPNADTLYTDGWIDTGPEPIILSVPATDRYFVIPMYSLWSDVFSAPGSRTTGRNRAVNILVVSPNWQGTVPAGLELVRAPTRYVGIIGRTESSGPTDYAAVHEIQAGIKLTPLSAWGKAGYVPSAPAIDPAIDMKTIPPKQVDNLSAKNFFKQFTALLADNPPSQIDYPMVFQLERVGIKVGSTFDLSTAPPNIQTDFENGVQEARTLLIDENARVSGAKAAGWNYTVDSGAYGANYLYRAGIADCCLGENLAADAVYPSAATDNQGRPLTGRHSYVIHFGKGKLPPVNGFWSITAYDEEGYFIPNAIKRQAIGDRNKLSPNPDGSVDLYIQAKSPGGIKDENWLPVTDGPFNLLMRLYWPKEEFLDGSWTLPQIKRVN